MKKTDKVSLISGLAAIAGVTAHEYLKKKKIIGKDVKTIYTVTPLSLLSGLIANRVIEEDAPRTYGEYLKDVADKNVR
ncbi:hypothetical protein [Catalinimonas niigatensis]|uniref:hypothetical protein n=1 Tax=Catalinimonas niigatensis TaxID=1397264 RepID=UPI0026653202|nr:hypothetical protein [Catalinimonas niigatensis]WPP49643.1 hypothetical protein PZB72_23495 [Catalinimonas niigatensis]